jgi:hypothetical protein
MSRMRVILAGVYQKSLTAKSGLKQKEGTATLFMVKFPFITLSDERKKSVPALLPEKA